MPIFKSTKDLNKSNSRRRMGLTTEQLRAGLNDPDPKIARRNYNALKKREERAKTKDNPNRPRAPTHKFNDAEKEQQRKDTVAANRAQRAQQQLEERMQRAEQRKVQAEQNARNPTQPKKPRKPRKTSHATMLKRLERKVFGPERKNDYKLVKKLKLERTRSAYNGDVADYSVKNNGLRLSTLIKGSEKLITNKILEMKNLKTMLRFKLTFGHTDPKTGVEETNTTCLTGGSMFTHYNPSEASVKKYYYNCLEKLMDAINRYQARGSGWYIKEILEIVLVSNKVKPQFGGSWIPLPPKLENSKSLVNKQNEDFECFRYSVLEALHPTKHNRHRISDDQLAYSKNYNWSGVTAPVSIDGIAQFEKNNKDIGLYVYKWEGNRIQVLWKTDKDMEPEDCIFLLHITESVGKDHPQHGNKDYERKEHYVLITKPWLFVTKFGTCLGEDKPNSHHKKWPCFNCGRYSYRESTIINHKKLCNNLNDGNVHIHYPGGKLQFKNHHKKMPTPVEIHMDFESVLKNINDKRGNTTRVQQHNAWSIGILKVDRIDGTSEYKSFKGKNIDERCIKHLTNEMGRIYRKYQVVKPLVRTEEVEHAFNTATHCWICEKEFGDEIHPLQPFPDPENPNNLILAPNPKVRDHCHYTGEFRGAAHSSCNLQFRKPSFVPVIVHNLMGYDIHHLIRAIAQLRGKQASCLAKDAENFISISKDIPVDWIDGPDTNENGSPKKVPIFRKLVFVDSLKFLNSSLDSLASNLINPNGESQTPEQDRLNLALKHMVVTHKHFPDLEKFKLVIKKGEFPYSYFNDAKKFKNGLPEWKYWRNDLTGMDISEKGKQHVLNVWNTFGCKTMEDYHDIYLKTDVCLLADVFGHFVQDATNKYGLNPLQYVTLPGFGFDALLKMSKVSLDIFNNSQTDMALHFDNAIRGGVSMIPKRYAEANNRYMKHFDDTKPTIYLMDFDRNNLYGEAMKFPLPTGNFMWMNKTELANWRKYLTTEGKGCNLTVDLHYPKELHDLHKDLPFAPEHIVVNGVKKLMSTLQDKKEYSVDYRLLDFYVRHGLKITKIHNGISYDESPWMASYIDLNTEYRSKATNKADQNLYKLMNNAPYGKTIEDVRKRTRIEICGSSSENIRSTRKVTFKDRKVIDENLVINIFQPSKVIMNKPKYVGATILDLSKLAMYEFHYDFVKPKYGDKVNILMTDTDSLLYEIQTDDVYKDMLENIHDKYDTSNYPKDHELYSNKNTRRLGFMKDEAGGKIITKFAGLGAKQYGFSFEDGKEEKRCKGVPKAITSTQLNLDMYIDCVFNGTEYRSEFNQIRSHNHTLFTEKTSKIALNVSDDKRIILKDKVNTLPLGHYALN